MFTRNTNGMSIQYTSDVIITTTLSSPLFVFQLPNHNLKHSSYHYQQVPDQRLNYLNFEYLEIFI